jgi:SpoVK/Ycf46/Vps4 family AAA+-type ATPase
VESLPPEFMRRGRFDEVFFVDLPSSEEREAIFRVQLERRGRDLEDFDLVNLARATDGFSGAEIEGVVVAALYRAYAEGGELTIAGLLQETAATMPLSRTRAEDVERLRAWSQGRAMPASRPEPDVPA